MPRKPKPKPVYGETPRTIRISDADWSAIGARARARGLTASEYMRARALEDRGTEAERLHAELRMLRVRIADLAR